MSEGARGAAGAGWLLPVAAGLLCCAAGCRSGGPRVGPGDAAPEGGDVGGESAASDGVGGEAAEAQGAEGGEPLEAGTGEVVEAPDEDTPGPLGSEPHRTRAAERGSDDPGPWVFFSPAQPAPGKPLRVIAVSAAPLAAPTLTLRAGSSEAEGLRRVEAWGGPPWAWAARVERAPEGRLRACLLDGEGEAACKTVRSERRAPADGSAPASGIWHARRNWNRRYEAFYAAWIGRLFLVEPGLTISWRPLHRATRDPLRNLLYDHRGLGEDDRDAPTPVVMEPDCGDAPYALRAYFAWKLDLPFGAHVCKRGNPGEGPLCEGEVISHRSTAWDHLPGAITRLNRFLGDTVSRYLHSGTVRTLPESDLADVYPVALARRDVRPGTLFVDPRGHVLVVTRWLPGTPDRIGTLFAIDGHPDRTVTHKRFSPVHFHFPVRLRTGGFKAFRPVRLVEDGVCFAGNAELAEAPPGAGYSLEQFGFPDEAAYHAHIDRLLNPNPPDPVLAYRSRMEQFAELLAERAEAVRVAVEYMESTGWERIPIPNGPDLFATSGPWEDYSSPARDIRLLLAADEFLAFPQRVAERPGTFALAPEADPEAVRAALEAAWEAGRRELSVVYTRSDGTPWTLTLEEVVGRLVRFEMAYNPNDCPEVRWGAEEGSEEYAPCVHRAPEGQLRLMNGYRSWFSARRQPSGLPTVLPVEP